MGLWLSIRTYKTLIIRLMFIDGRGDQRQGISTSPFPPWAYKNQAHTLKQSHLMDSNPLIKVCKPNHN